MTRTPDTFEFMQGNGDRMLIRLTPKTESTH